MQIDSLLSKVPVPADYSGWLMLAIPVFCLLALILINHLIQNGIAKLFGFSGIFDTSFKLGLAMVAVLLAWISATGIFEQKVSGFHLDFKPIETILLPNEANQAVVYLAASLILLIPVLLYGIRKRFTKKMPQDKRDKIRKRWLTLIIVYNVIAVVGYAAIHYHVINPKIDLFRHALQQKISK